MMDLPLKIALNLFILVPTFPNLGIRDWKLALHLATLHANGWGQIVSVFREWQVWGVPVFLQFFILRETQVRTLRANLQDAVTFTTLAIHIPSLAGIGLLDCTDTI